MPYFESAVAKAPGFYDVYNARARGYEALKKPDKAIEDCTHALSIKAEDEEVDVDTLILRGYLYLQLKPPQPQSAIDDYTKVIDLYDQKAERYTARPQVLGPAFFWRGVAYSFSDLTRAAADLDKAISLTKGESAGQAYYASGLVKKAQGDDVGAIHAFSTAASLFAGVNDQARQKCQEMLSSIKAPDKPSSPTPEPTIDPAVSRWIAQHPFESGVAAILGFAIIEGLDHKIHQQGSAGPAGAGQKICSTCGGTGKVNCSRCGGTGRDPSSFTEYRTCDQCNTQHGAEGLIYPRQIYIYPFTSMKPSSSRSAI